jgi:hypothetical protein
MALECSKGTNVCLATILHEALFAECLCSDLDTVTLAPGLVITQQSIGVARVSEGFSPFDGILGFVAHTSPLVAGRQLIPFLWSK